MPIRQRKHASKYDRPLPTADEDSLVNIEMEVGLHGGIVQAGEIGNHAGELIDQRLKVDLTRGNFDEYLIAQ